MDVGCFQDIVCEDPSNLYNNCTKECLHFNHFTLLTPHQLCTKVAKFGFVLHCFGLIPWWCPLQAETCGNIKCDTCHYPRNESLHFVGWCCELGIDYARNTQYKGRCLCHCSNCVLLMDRALFAKSSNTFEIVKHRTGFFKCLCWTHYTVPWKDITNIGMSIIHLHFCDKSKTCSRQT